MPRSGGRGAGTPAASGIAIETVETSAAGRGHANCAASVCAGYRKFLAVGGDGTSYEMVNGLFPESQTGSGDASGQIPTLGFLPWGRAILFCAISATGIPPIMAWSTRCGRWRRGVRGLAMFCGSRTKTGTIYYTNLLSVGFAADVAALRHRRFLGLGQVGYLLSIFLCLARLNRRPFPVRFEGQGEFDSRRCLFLTFNNSKFTGGTMMIAPDAVTDDGLIEYVRWGPIGRAGADPKFGDAL